MKKNKYVSVCRHKDDGKIPLPPRPWKVVHQLGMCGHAIVAADGRTPFIGTSTLEVCTAIVNAINKDFK